MPRGLRSERRPADVNVSAVMIAHIVSGELSDNVPTPEDEGHCQVDQAEAIFTGQTYVNMMIPLISGRFSV